MNKMLSLLTSFVLAAALLTGCAQDQAVSSFKHGIYEVWYETAITQTDEGVPAVRVDYKYYAVDGKKVKSAYNLGVVFGFGGLYGMYLKVDGFAYSISAVHLNHEDGKTEVTSVVEAPEVTETSILEVCYAGLETYVERDGNRIYYAPYLLGELAENGNRQVLIDLAYINGFDIIRQDGKISGPCYKFYYEIDMIMKDEPFTVRVGETEYTANTLCADIEETTSGDYSFCRLALMIEVPADTPADVAISVS